MSVYLAAIVAMAENRCIGVGNDLPWHIPEDLKYFKDKTRGKPVVMGRRTYESVTALLNKPLPDRPNIVVTRSGTYRPPHADKGEVIICHSLDEAIEKAKTRAQDSNSDEVMIAGGAEIYRQALPRLDRLYRTVIHKNYDGDAYFPALDMSSWTVTAATPRDGDPPYTFQVLERSV